MAAFTTLADVSVDPSVLAAIRAAVDADPANCALRAHLAELLEQSGHAGAALTEARRVLAEQADHLGALAVAERSARATGEVGSADSYQRLLEALGGGRAATAGPDQRSVPADPPTGAKPSPSSPPPDRAGDASDGPPLRPHRPAGMAPGERLPGADPFGVAIPDTADELFEEWADADAAEEPDVGELGRPTIRLADVGGMDDVKKRIDQSFLAPLRNPELSMQFGKSLRGGLLLWGPPGCGKTLIARALAGELDANFYEVGLADVLDMWIGSSERNIRSIFDFARRNRPCVLFFDEIDALGQKRSHLRVAGSAMRGVVNQLLAELDGVSSDNEGIFVLAATNHPWDVDPALVRPGRFDRRVVVLPPDEAARRSIAGYHLRDRPVEGLDLAKLAKATDGYSGADIALVCEEATEQAMHASLESGRMRPITQRQLMQAARSVTPSIGPWFDTARNYALYNNEGGDFDDLLRYLKTRR